MLTPLSAITSMWTGNTWNCGTLGRERDRRPHLEGERVVADDPRAPIDQPAGAPVTPTPAALSPL